MKSQAQWFDEYAESHQNPVNQRIHFICVPIIFFSIVGMLMSLDATWLQKILPFHHPLIANWATVFLLLTLIFYWQLSFKTFTEMLLLSILALVGNYYLSKLVPLFYVSLALFILAWIGQFYGHKVEGKKPSFFKDLQFLLIGPAWVLKKIFG